MIEQQELPELSGTAKQIARAEKIRSRILAELNGKIIKALEFDAREEYTLVQLDYVMPFLYAAIEKIQAQSSARWWIENRTVTDKELFLLVKNIAFVIAIYEGHNSAKKVTNVP